MSDAHGGGTTGCSTGELFLRERSVHGYSRRDVLQLAAAAGACAALGGIALGLASCGDDAEKAARGKRVVAYVSVDDALARTVLAACSAATGVAIDPVFDTEASKTTGLENRIRSEAARPRADLFWSSESFALARLASEGLLRPLPHELWNAWPQQYRDASGCWIAFAARARVVVRNTRFTQHAAIASWSDLALVEGIDSSMTALAIADPRFGTTRAHLAALHDTWTRARAAGEHVPTLEEWLDGLRERGVRVVLGGNAACVDVVASGECAYAMTDSDDALAAIARGLPIEMMLPRTLPHASLGGGTMLIPNTVGLIAGRESAGADTQRAAEEVAAWLVSAPSQQLMCESPSRNLPLAVSVACTPAFEELDPQSFDAARASANATTIAVDAHQRLTRGRSTLSANTTRRGEQR